MILCYFDFRSPYKLFVRNYVGEKSPEEAWKSMSKDEQKRYQTELDIVKKEYLAEFKKFLENLDKKQLKEFADRRKNRKTSDNEDSPDDANDAVSLHFLFFPFFYFHFELFAGKLWMFFRRLGISQAMFSLVFIPVCICKFNTIKFR